MSSEEYKIIVSSLPALYNAWYKSKRSYPAAAEYHALLYNRAVEWCKAHGLEDESWELIAPVQDIPGTDGGGEDATAHEWNFGHPWRGTNKTCWRCEEKKILDVK